MKIRVAQGVQVVHDGTVYLAGETAEVPEALARNWNREGWAAKVKSRKAHGDE